MLAASAAAASSVATPADLAIIASSVVGSVVLCRRKYSRRPLRSTTARHLQLPVREEVGECLNVGVRYARHDSVHVRIGADAFIVAIRLHRRDEIVLRLPGEPRHFA